MKKIKIDITIPYTKPGVVLSGGPLGAIKLKTVAIHGIEPAKQPNQKGKRSPLPVLIYRSCNQPNKIMHTFTPAIPSNAM